MPARKNDGEGMSASDEIVTRTFRAPRSLVFEVWTKAEHFERWFGPRGAEVFDCELDARPGGVIRFGHRFAGGPALHLKGTFVELIPDERLVLGFGFVDEQGRPVRHPMFPEWPLDISVQMRVTFEDVDEGTKVTVSHGVLPLDAASHPETKRWLPLALEGSKQVLDCLGEYLALRAAREGRMT